LIELVEPLQNSPREIVELYIQVTFMCDRHYL
jgi:hypothetical protein